MLRALLAALALRPGQVVPASELIHQLWGQEPPPTARTTLRNYVMRLRKTLPEGRIRTAAGGYQLVVAEAETDVGQLRELLRHSRKLTAGAPAAALEVLEEALGLWRGTPLEDIGDCPLRTAEQARLEELRLTATEERFELKIALGQHTEIIDELTAAAHTHHLRERLARQLMLALYRSERTADALAVYRAVRERLIDELGLEPGLELRHLEQAILRDDPELLHPAPLPGRPDAGSGRRTEGKVMTGFPAAIGTFVARDRELTLIGRWLTASAGPAICLVDGAGGVGKSTLAVRAAREAAERFPGGLLYADLRGADPRNPALEPEAALGLLLTALSVPQRELPQDLAAATALYRERLRGRRVLVLLDNARDARQVQPLLPDDQGSAAIVTSRTMLAGLPGGHHLHLDRLSLDDAVELLRSDVGGRAGGGGAGNGGAAGTGDAPPDAADWEELARLCGQLPLALRIVATRMAARPHWSVQDWNAVLRQEHGRMDQLRVADLDLRASLMVSIDQLAAGDNRVDLRAARMFPRLGMASVHSFTADTAAALAGCTAEEAEQALERLTDARITDSPCPGRYTLHDLLRSAAACQTARVPAPAVRERLAALCGWYLGSLHRIHDVLELHEINRVRGRHGRRRFPHGTAFTGVDQALHWIEGTVEDMVSLAEQLAAPAHDTGTELGGRALSAFGLEAALALEPYFSMRMAWRHQERLCRLVLEVARRQGDIFGEATALGQLGKVTAQRGDTEAGELLLDRAVSLYASAGNWLDGAVVTSNLLVTITINGRHEESIRRTEEVLAEADSREAIDTQVLMLSNLAWSCLRVGQLQRAHDAALEAYRRASFPYPRVMTAGLLAEYHLMVNRSPEAARWAERGLAHAADWPLDPQGVAHLRSLLARALRGTGLDEAADAQARQAEQELEALNRRESSNVRLRPIGGPVTDGGPGGGSP
jgi:DNA-binding SARP family transcriptional activator